MNILDVVIVGLLILGAYLGMRAGFIRSSVKIVGLVGALVIAFLSKGFISEYLYRFLPFFNLFGEVRGIQIFNIVFYELIAFLIVFAILLIGYRILMMVSSLFETILNATFILGIPSKILGFFVGLLYYFVIIFIVLYIFSLPFFDNQIMKESTLAKPILTETPFLSTWTDDAYQVFDELADLKEQYQTDEDVEKFNREALDILLKYRIVEVETIEYLVARGKLDIDNIEQILDKYR